MGLFLRNGNVALVCFLHQGRQELCQLAGPEPAVTGPGLRMARWAPPGCYWGDHAVSGRRTWTGAWGHVLLCSLHGFGPRPRSAHLTGGMTEHLRLLRLPRGQPCVHTRRALGTGGTRGTQAQRLSGFSGWQRGHLRCRGRAPRTPSNRIPTSK